MSTIIGLCGSSRRGSFNLMLLRAAAEVAPLGATPGQGGTALAQAAWLPVLRTLGMLPWFEGRLLISSAGKTFTADGRLADDATRDRLRTFVEGFSAFAARSYNLRGHALP